MVQLGPEAGGLLAQRLVVVLSGKEGLALAAVQPTDGYHFVHVFSFIGMQRYE